MNKVGRLYELCQMDNQLGQSYRDLWDRLAAVQQEIVCPNSKVLETEVREENLVGEDIQAKMPTRLSLLERAKNFAGAAARYVQSGFKNIPDEEYEKRLQVCKSCEYLKDEVCTLCGCYVSIKARWATEDCPDNPSRWPKIELPQIPPPNAAGATKGERKCGGCQKRPELDNPKA